MLLQGQLGQLHCCNLVRLSILVLLASGGLVVGAMPGLGPPCIKRALSELFQFCFVLNRTPPVVVQARGAVGKYFHDFIRSNVFRLEFARLTTEILVIDHQHHVTGFKLWRFVLIFSSHISLFVSECVVGNRDLTPCITISRSFTSRPKACSLGFPRWLCVRWLGAQP